MVALSDSARLTSGGLGGPATCAETFEIDVSRECSGAGHRVAGARAPGECFESSQHLPRARPTRAGVTTDVCRRVVCGVTSAVRRGGPPVNPSDLRVPVSAFVL